MKTNITSLAIVFTAQASLVLSGQVRVAVVQQQTGQACEACQADTYVATVCDREIGTLRNSSRVQPTSSVLLKNLAECIWHRSFLARDTLDERQNARTEAQNLLRQSIMMDPSNVAALYELSTWTDDAVQKEALLVDVLKAQPNNQNARADLARTHLVLGRVDEAVGEFLMFLSNSSLLERESLSNAVAFGNQLADASRFAYAVQVYRLALDRAKGMTRFDQCTAFQNANTAALASDAAFMREVAELRPYCTNTEHRDNAVALMTRGLVDEAIPELLAQIRVNPKYDEAYLILARLYRQKGNDKEAFETLRRYVDAEPDLQVQCTKFKAANMTSLAFVDPTFVQRLNERCKN